MSEPSQTRIGAVFQKHNEALLNEWVSEQLRHQTQHAVGERELREQCAEFVTLLRERLAQGIDTEVNGPEWSRVREFLGRMSRSRALQGFAPSETARFLLSLKRPLFARLQAEAKDRELLAEEIWTVTLLLDELGLYSVELFQKGREEVIMRQQHELLELSTPVVKLWDGVLALPLIGTLDSARTQVVMESLLQKIVETSSSVAIIDITGVPTVDTLVAQHLLKTVTAARLMGAECIISGIRPQIAQTIVHLGVELGDVTTKSNLADAFIEALRRVGADVTGRQPGRAH